jgi:two-component system, LytTR family, sensor histidine kinase AlgZ
VERGEVGRTIRESLTFRRLMVTLGVAGTMGVVEWVGLGHPIGLVFGVAMGFLALLVAPLPWLWLLPWGLKRPALQILLRAAAVVAIGAAVVAAAFALYYLAVRAVVPRTATLLLGAWPNLDAWASAAVATTLFVAAGWGLARHLELERRLEVHDARELALRGALEQARLLALEARLDPHFLFNGLNLVVELCRDDPLEAERCVLRLSALLRAALEHREQPLVPLGRELDLCADYLELCRARYGARLAVELERDPAAMAAQVPSLAVQALCENAVRHGIERVPAGGTVRVAAAARDGVVEVTVTSPGPFRGEREGGVGLALTRRRLALSFGVRAALEVGTAPDGATTRARLTLPAGGTP